MLARESRWLNFRVVRHSNHSKFCNLPLNCIQNKSEDELHHFPILLLDVVNFVLEVVNVIWTYKVEIPYDDELLCGFAASFRDITSMA